MKNLVFLLAVVVVIAGCVGTTNQKSMVKDEGKTMKNDTSVKTTSGEGAGNESMMHNVSGGTAKYSGQILAGSSAPVIDFNKADYDNALKSGKVVFLYFYATWCPICRAEVPELYAAFNELKTDNVIGFRVNFNDGDTDADERKLAEQLQVPYQHTKVIIKDGKATKFPDGWDKQRYLGEINKVLG